MKTKLYIVVHVEMYDDNLDLGPTGHKEVAVYLVNSFKGELDLLTELKIELSAISIIAVANWLNDNGYNSDDYNMEAL